MIESSVTSKTFSLRSLFPSFIINHKVSTPQRPSINAHYTYRSLYRNHILLSRFLGWRHMLSSSLVYRTMIQKRFTSLVVFPSPKWLRLFIKNPNFQSFSYLSQLVLSVYQA
mmetsp:Transcript_14585/g.19051  ORF Transcript_14585/g.19051 Transcript_14585/m.19051 type:complete len:112 (-) Transcript_14585:1057-1392(-)